MGRRLTDQQERLLERIALAGRLRIPLGDWRRRKTADWLKELGLIRWNDGWEIVPGKYPKHLVKPTTDLTARPPEEPSLFTDYHPAPGEKKAGYYG